MRLTRILHVSDGVSASSQCLLLQKLLASQFDSRILTVKSEGHSNCISLSPLDRLRYSAANRIDTAVSKFLRLEGRTGLSFIKLDEAIRRYSPNILHVHVAKSGLLRWSELETLELPTVISLHDLWPVLPTSSLPFDKLNKGNKLQAAVIHRLARLKRRIALKDTVHFVAPSINTLEHLLEIVPEVADRAHVISNVIKVSSDHKNYQQQREKARARFNIPNDDRIVAGVVAHRDSPEKRLELHIRLKNSMPELITVGCGSASADLGFDIAIGSLPHEDMRFFLTACDFLFLPSNFESFSQVAAEALLQGCPLIHLAPGGFTDFSRDGEGRFRLNSFEPEAVRLTVARAYATDRTAVASYTKAKLNPRLILNRWRQFYDSIATNP